MNNNILVVEDNRETCIMLSAALGDAGFAVHCVGTVKAAKEFFKHSNPCVMILDVNLPDGNGLNICSWVRTAAKQENLPIIALTGQDDLQDKVKGFCAGVDQYLTKPIVMSELVMWVKALLRRVDMDKSGGAVLTVLDLQLDRKSQIVKYRAKPVENLTRREFDLLYALVKNTPRIFSRQEILEEVWHTVALENLVDIHMFNLRKKLPPELSRKIQAVAGRGFRYFDKS